MKLVRGFALILGAATAAVAFSTPASAHDRNDDGDGTKHGGQVSSGNFGLLNGNQAYIPIDIPINVCGNSIALLGLANTQAGCSND